MSSQASTKSGRTRNLWLLGAGTICIVASILLMTGLLVPGFLDDRSEGSAMPEAPSGSAPLEGPRELSWAQIHLDQSNLTPDAAVALVARRFVARLNTGRAADAVDMLCATKRRLIRGPVVWTATHQAHLRVTTPLKGVARPGYVTIRFVGAIQARQRSGTFGIDTDAQGRPRCVSAFYSVG